MRVNAFRATLETVYAGVPAPMCASDAASLDTFTIRPCSLRRSNGKNSCTISHGPYTFVSAASLTTARSAVTARCHVS
jgi:hypothetical protein